MGPRDERHTPQDDLFRSELVNLIDPRHPLVKLADRIDWSVFEREWSELFASPTGRSAAPPRLIAGLIYLQHAYNLSDEAVVERWVENPYMRVPRTLVETPTVLCQGWEFGLPEPACRSGLQTT